MAAVRALQRAHGSRTLPRAAGRRDRHAPAAAPRAHRQPDLRRGDGGQGPRAQGRRRRGRGLRRHRHREAARSRQARGIDRAGLGRSAGDDRSLGSDARAEAAVQPFFGGCSLPQDAEAHRLTLRAWPRRSACRLPRNGGAAAAATRRAARWRPGTRAERPRAHRLPGLRRGPARGRHRDGAALGGAGRRALVATSARCARRRPPSCPTSAASASATVALAALADAAALAGATVHQSYPSLHGGLLRRPGRHVPRRDATARGACSTSPRSAARPSSPPACSAATTCARRRDGVGCRVDVHFWPEFFTAAPRERRVAGRERDRQGETDDREAAEPPRRRRSRTNPVRGPRRQRLQAAPAEAQGPRAHILDDPRMHDHTDGFQCCIQCGICTSGCPAARFTDYSPREIARRALDGDETLLTDDSRLVLLLLLHLPEPLPAQEQRGRDQPGDPRHQVEHGHGRQSRRGVRRAGARTSTTTGMGGTRTCSSPTSSRPSARSGRSYIAHLLEFREQLGLGRSSPPKKAVAEVRTIMEETGFKARLESLGAWGGERHQGK